MNNDPRLFDAFDACLSRMAAGESVEGCLASYPDLATELGPMLDAARFAQAAAPVPHRAQMRSRARLLAAAAARRPATQPRGRWGAWLRRALSTGITLAVGFMLGTTGLYYASASTLPGDSLYGVKRAFEGARLQMAKDPGQRFSLEENYNDLRAAELRAVLAEDRAVVVNFGGVLTNRSASAWQVGGFTVQLEAETRIVGEPQPGFYVSVTAENRNGTLVALQLESEEVQVIGVLQQSGGLWAINGMTFSVGPETVVSGEVVPGATAAARLRTLETGDRVAVSLTTLAPTVLPTPSPSPTTSPTTTEQPTRTVQPSPTRAPTQTPLPPTATPTQAPEQQPAFISAPTDDHGGDGNQNENSNQNVSGGEDQSGGNEDSNSNSDSGDNITEDNSGSGDRSGSEGDGSQDGGSSGDGEHSSSEDQNGSGSGDSRGSGGGSEDGGLGGSEYSGSGGGGS